jgi:uncharacterized C2H2 Zn-finger protein
VPGEPERTLRCPLCGQRFARDEAKKCSACPVRGGCKLLCCPRCGYGFVEESRLLKLMSRWLGRKKGHEAPASERAR